MPKRTSSFRQPKYTFLSSPCYFCICLVPDIYANQQENPCQCCVYARCVNISGSMACHCKDGFYGNGTHCSDVDECSVADNDCGRKAGHVSTQLEVLSAAVGPVFTITEARVSTYITICQQENHKCDVNAICINTRGSYDCTCTKGFIGNGRACADIDEVCRWCAWLRRKCNMRKYRGLV